jgi:four helix bundle protein
MLPFLYDQLLRASSSVVLNLAEGSAKRTPPDQRRFYNIAFASLRECEAILDLEKIEKSSLLEKINQLSAILFTLSRDPANRNRTKTPTQTIDPN